MRVLIDEQNELYGENFRLVKTLMKRESPDEYPEVMKWALQTLYFDGEEWVEICRIDNYRHENLTGSHIHLYGKEQVKRKQISYQEAYREIKTISKKILAQQFDVQIAVGDD